MIGSNQGLSVILRLPFFDRISASHPGVPRSGRRPERSGTCGAARRHIEAGVSRALRLCVRASSTPHSHGVRGLVQQGAGPPGHQRHSRRGGRAYSGSSPAAGRNQPAGWPPGARRAGPRLRVGRVASGLPDRVSTEHGAVGNRNARNTENLVEPSVEGTTVRFYGSRLLGPAAVLAVDAVVVVRNESKRPPPHPAASRSCCLTQANVGDCVTAT